MLLLPYICSTWLSSVQVYLYTEWIIYCIIPATGCVTDKKETSVYQGGSYTDAHILSLCTLCLLFLFSTFYAVNCLGHSFNTSVSRRLQPYLVRHATSHCVTNYCCYNLFFFFLQFTISISLFNWKKNLQNVIGLSWLPHAMSLRLFWYVQWSRHYNRLVPSRFSYSRWPLRLWMLSNDWVRVWFHLSRTLPRENRLRNSKNMISVTSVLVNQSQLTLQIRKVAT